MYAAEHHRLGQRSAIKVIWGDLLGDSRAFERFMREAQACRALESRYIIKLEDVAELQEGLPMLVLELVEGESFDRHLFSTGPLPVAHAALFASQVAAGLADAHAGKVIHRDLKPANVMVVHGADRDTAKIVDFGLAMQMDLAGATKLTQSGTVTGTPAYLAPEQIMGEPPTTASDLYALGVMIYETVTGVQPFVGSSPQEVCAKHLYKKPNMRRMKGPLRDIVGGLLNKQPEDRLGDAAEVSRQLAEVAGAERRFGPPLSG